MKTDHRGLAALALAVGLTGCPDGQPPVAEGIFAAMGEPIPSATDDQRAAFERGREVAEHRFTAAEGLGPDYNVTFCGSCHEKPVTGGSGPRYRNFLLVGQRLSDGSYVEAGVNGVQPLYTLHEGPRRGTDPGTNVTATRNAVPFFGTGLIAEIPDEIVLENADPDDEDGDGISGRPNYDRGFVGRFGRKAQTVSIEGFIRGPLFNHVGITSNPLSDERKNALPVPSGSSATGVGESLRGLTGIGTSVRGQAAAPDEPIEDDDDAPDPELSEDDLFDLVSFSMLLAAPAPDAPTEQTDRGKATFSELGCDGCHVEGLESPRGLIPLYSDLLLHDMGEDLADGIPMKEASGSEFKTQPLWGLVATGPYLHDGRADTIDDAIRMHGGEGEASKVAYEALDPAAREDVLAFLRSLGGASQASSGLLDPQAPVPAVGEYGGPQTALDPTEEAQYLSGREIFDRDFAVDAGLGPLFNGDACRACHFEPTIGGAGPLGVNVVRHGTDVQGTFTPPSIGTMAYRLGLDRQRRAPADLEANVFELRQTPPIFGLGAVESIPESEIVAREDPQDMDGDGIRGFAYRLEDGRLGRFGWKANVPTLAEFARDAISNEIGLTVPPVAGRTFGFLGDDDDIADPEIDEATLDDLTFFMGSLSAPPRTSTDAPAEQRGERLFLDVGCDGCHVPSMPDAEGNPVPLYSDLLLHDVQVADFVGIPDGNATARHFRTSPLWGLATTAPYMHDGMAFSIEQSIARHEAEAEASRTAYEMLSETERADLLAFLRSL